MRKIYLDFIKIKRRNNLAKRRFIFLILRFILRFLNPCNLSLYFDNNIIGNKNVVIKGFTKKIWLKFY